MGCSITYLLCFRYSVGFIYFIKIRIKGIIKQGHSKNRYYKMMINRIEWVDEVGVPIVATKKNKYGQIEFVISCKQTEKDWRIAEQKKSPEKIYA